MGNEKGKRQKNKIVFIGRYWIHLFIGYIYLFDIFACLFSTFLCLDYLCRHLKLK